MRVIRVTGVLAVVASVGLVILLLSRIHTAEISGPVGRRLLVPEPSLPQPGVVCMALPGQKAQAEIDRWILAGPMFIGSEAIENGRMTTYFDFHISEEATRAAQIGDELVIRAMSVSPPGMSGSSLKHARYELRRGAESQFFDEPANGKFILVCGLLVCAPLLLWGMVAGIAAVSEAVTKSKPQS